MINANRYIFGKSNTLPLLLDTYPSKLGFSLFKIRTAYTGPCIRVVRSSDNSSLDIGFSSGVLDTASLLSFVGSSSGYVTRWYSQIGSNFASNGTLPKMPRIVSAGTLDTLNGKPAIYFDGVDDRLFLNSPEVVNNDFSVYGYGKRFASGSMFSPLLSGISTTLMQYIDNNYYLINSAGFNISSSTDVTANNILLEGHSTALARTIYKNQSLIASTPNLGSFGNAFNNIGGDYNGNYTKGHLTEVILYDSNQITNRVAIGNDIITRNS
jgi:hypothetical protein